MHQPMSALAPKADMCGATSDVRFGPIADILLVTRSANAAGRSARAPIRFATLHITIAIGGRTKQSRKPN
jgi:hypothetical protein